LGFGVDNLLIRKKIALINHQPLMLEALIRIFCALESCRLTDAILPAPEKIEDTLLNNPDLIILDCGDQHYGLKTVSRIREVCPDTRVLVFASTSSVDFAVRALEAGAAGYVCTTATAEELTSAAQAVADGDTFISPKIATKVIVSLRAAAIRKKAMRQQRLNFREEQIAGLLLKGRTNRQIAETLGLSEKTIKHYMHHLMQKLNAKNRLELALAMRTGPAVDAHFVN
jgi:DNA-binding NarL/FixJ family response regulator